MLGVVNLRNYYIIHLYSKTQVGWQNNNQKIIFPKISMSANIGEVLAYYTTPKHERVSNDFAQIFIRLPFQYKTYP